jgi:hypothetical protein
MLAGAAAVVHLHLRLECVVAEARLVDEALVLAQLPEMVVDRGLVHGLPSTHGMAREALKQVAVRNSLASARDFGVHLIFTRMELVQSRSRGDRHGISSIIVATYEITTTLQIIKYLRCVVF